MKLIRFPDVQTRVGIKRTAIYRLIGQGIFPRPVKQGTASFWVEEEIDAYLQKIIAARRGSQPIAASS